MAAILGLNAKLYRLTTGSRATWGAADSNGLHAGSAPASLDEIINVKDLSWKSDDNEANVSTRGNNGYEAIMAALSKVELTFSMVHDPSDADLLALLKAKIAKTSIACAALDQDKATSGSIGFWADWAVLGADKTENLEEGQMWNFTLKPALTSVAPEWVKVS